MIGELFVYGANAQGSKLAAFISSPENFTSAAEADCGALGCVVLVGGLTDGLLSLPYSERLATRTRVVYPVFTSGLTGFGVCSLQSDALELHQLLGHPKMASFKDITLLGHSTGCQVILHYVYSGSVIKALDRKITRIVLQGPVSDREAFLGRASAGEADDKGVIRLPIDYYSRDTVNHAAWRAAIWASNPKVSDECMLGGDDSLLLGAPLKAGRVRSLLGRLGAEDYFSTDLSREEMLSKVGHEPNQNDIHSSSTHGNFVTSCESHQLHVMCILSGLDEYVPDREAYFNFFQLIFCPALAFSKIRVQIPSDADFDDAKVFLVTPSVSLHVIKGANHACSNRISQAVKLALSEDPTQFLSDDITDVPIHSFSTL
jgi:pimeloyl-ACP methyl ester carboxylesterase